MSYSKTEIINLALNAIRDHDLVFISEVAAYLPCDKKTFYNKKLHELHSIKEALEANKIERKRELREKWYKSDNATVQIALYRLLSDEEENDKLNGGKQRQEITGELTINSAEENFYKNAMKANGEPGDIK